MVQYEYSAQYAKQKLVEGNKAYVASRKACCEASTETLLRLVKEGQHPYAIIVACSDSRVIPEVIFQAGLGDLFVIRVAGNVMESHQLGSIEYAAEHLGTGLIVVLGHDHCGAVDAALNHQPEGYIKYITDDIIEAIGEERDPDQAAELNVRHAVDRLRREFSEHPEMDGVSISGAVFNILTGNVRWIDMENS